MQFPSVNRFVVRSGTRFGLGLLAALVVSLSSAPEGIRAQTVSGKPVPLVPDADGWYALLRSDELGPGEVKPLHYFGRELVVFRTESGQAVVSDAFCPHMGAHFGQGGEVRGEALRCPFHGFCFEPSGDCVEIPESYEGRPIEDRGPEIVPFGHIDPRRDDAMERFAETILRHFPAQQN